MNLPVSQSSSNSLGYNFNESKDFEVPHSFLDEDRSIARSDIILELSRSALEESLKSKISWYHVIQRGEKFSTYVDRFIFITPEY